MTVHVSNAFKAEFQRLASTHGVSESALALRMIEEALRLGVEHQHASLLEAVVQQTIRESIAAHAGRLGDLAQRAALYGDESRRLTLPGTCQRRGRGSRSRYAPRGPQRGLPAPAGIL